MLLQCLSREKYESLRQSIKQNGLWVPIVVNKDGVILDGHHRYKACQELGIEPTIVTKEFDGKLEEQLFVIDSNLKRRQLNHYQSIKLALKSKPIFEQNAKKNRKSNLKQNASSPSAKHLAVGRVYDQIAKLAGVSHETVRKVDLIEQDQQKQAPRKPLLISSVIGDLESGDISINSAYNALQDAKRQDWGLAYRIKKGNEERDRILRGEKPPDYKKLYEQAELKLQQKEIKHDEHVEIIASQKKELEWVKANRNKVEPAPPQQQQQEQKAEVIPKRRVDKLEDYDPTKRDSYDRQTLYNVIEWLQEELRKARAIKK